VGDIRKNLIPLTCFHIFISLLLIADYNLYASEVIKRRKKRKVAVINQGSDDGLSKGDKICFYSSKGGKVACGKIRRIKKNKSFVKVNKKRFRKVRVGMTASAEGSASLKFNIKGGYLLTVAAPSTYEKLAFVPPDGQVETVWSSLSTNTDNYVGGWGEIEIPISGFGLALGGRMKIYGTFKYDSDYKTAQESSNEFVTFEQSISNLGFWLMLNFAQINIGPIISFYGGLDIDNQTISLSISQNSDEGDSFSIFSGQSNLTVISLAAATQLEMDLGTIGLFATPKILLPISSSGGALSGDEIVDTEITNAISNPNEDLQTALNHIPSSFAFEVLIGTKINF